METPIECTGVEIRQIKPKTKKCKVCGSDNTILGIDAHLYFNEDSNAIDFIYTHEECEFYIYCNDCENVSNAGA